MTLMNIIYIILTLFVLQHRSIMDRDKYEYINSVNIFTLKRTRINSRNICKHLIAFGFY